MLSLSDHKDSLQEQKYVLSSERLLFRPFEHTDVDLEHLYSLDSDPDVRRFFPDCATREDAKKSLERFLDLWGKHRLTRFAVFDKETGHFIGRAGFMFLEDTDEIELGYAFFKEYWGKGLATEASRALLSWLRENHPDVKRIICFTTLENRPSVAVMERLGMCFWKDEDYKGIPHCFYELEV